MEKHERKFIGIIGARENTEKYLSQMDIPEDAFILDINEALENVPVMEWLEKRSREIAPREMDADTLLGTLEFAELDQVKDCMTGQLQGGQVRRLLLLKALLSNKHYMVIWNVFDGLGESDIKMVEKILIEYSTFADIILLSGNDKGLTMCNELIYC